MSLAERAEEAVEAAQREAARAKFRSLKVGRWCEGWGGCQVAGGLTRGPGFDCLPFMACRDRWRRVPAGAAAAAPIACSESVFAHWHPHGLLACSPTRGLLPMHAAATTTLRPCAGRRGCDPEAAAAGS